MRPPLVRLALLSSIALLGVGCKTIPPDRYGIRRLNIEGASELDEEAIRACLASSERERLGVDLGTTSDLTCGEAPFDGGRLRVRLFPWPWAEWPTLDASIFERDLERIERWYRARGYYDARVLAAEFDPPSAAQSDELPETGDAPCERRDDDEGCSVDITIRVEEGEPVILRSLAIGSTPNVPTRVRRSIERAPLLEIGERFDESLYDDTKERMLSRLREAGYACASVEGHVTVDPDAHTAAVVFDVHTGPVGHFDNIEVVVSGDAEGIPLDTVRGAAGIDRGDRYSTTRITAAQRAIYGLGAFASVEVVATPRQVPGEGGAPATCGEPVDVVITVTPGRRLRYGIGFGMQTGETQALAGTQTNQRQWDLHLQMFLEHRNFLGGLRRFRIEERPKLVFPNAFPRVTDQGDPDVPNDTARPNVGNELRATFRQPAFLESRTTLEIGARWDYGLDPINTASLRHDIEASAVVSRPFWDGRIQVSLGTHSQSYIPARSISALHDPPNDPQPDYHLFFFSQSVRLDLRNDVRSTRRGAYFAVDLQEALPRSVSTFTYIRFVPEARFFIPLPLRSVLAMRFAIGMMYGIDYDYGHRGRGDDDTVSNEAEIKSCALGPTRYRLRGGGPTSHRGFSPATLADIDEAGSSGPDGDPAVPRRCRNGASPTPDPHFDNRDGGIRRWEASVELRTRITESFGLVGFMDMGDVNRVARFRFNNPNTALGFGLRYYTIVGPIRLDWSFFPRRMQHWGDGDNNVRHPYYFKNNVHGTFTLTIGEAF